MKKKPILIVLDAGHGTNTAGKRTPLFPDGSFIKEYEFNRPVVDLVAEKLKKYSVEIMDSAPEDADIALSTRVSRINAMVRSFRARHSDGVAALVSVHFNAHKSDFFESSTANGLEVLHFGSTEGQKLAQNLLDEVIKNTPQRNRGLKVRTDLAILRDPILPCALIEFGFMDDLREAKLMIDKAYQEECAEEIVVGLCKYFDIDFIPEKEECESCKLLSQKLEATEKAFSEMKEKLTELSKMEVL
jgi:N-acetylmuramoyl-L-alanine amidase